MAAESLPAVEAVLEAMLADARVEEAAPVVACRAATVSGGLAGGISSVPAAGRASLLAAQASKVTRAKERSMAMEKYLFDGASNIRN